MNKLIYILLFLFLTIGFVFADIIYMKNGESAEGVITSADEDSIYLQVNDEIIKSYPQNMVEKIFFDKADMVFLLDKTSIKCKIIGKEFPNLDVITEDGMQKIRLIELKIYFHNYTDSLMIDYLPPTGELFLNKENYISKSEIKNKRIFIGFVTGAGFPPSAYWKDYFITAANVFSLNFAAQGGYFLTNNFSAGAGCEISLTDNTTPDINASDFSRIFVYLSLNYEDFIKFSSKIHIFCGADMGIFLIKGNLYTYSYRQVKIDEYQFSPGFRANIGLKYQLSEQTVLRIKTGYDIANSYEVDYPVEGFQPIDIDFNSVTTLIGIHYYFSM